MTTSPPGGAVASGEGLGHTGSDTHTARAQALAMGLS
jgi:hypothetical protein